MPHLSHASAAAATLALALTFAVPARADIVVTVDKSTQRMDVSINGQHRYTWAVSTGVRGTPSGNFRAQSLDRNHHSAR
jgi:lipoprotein-anchoring transpeptidase ErfK/SrfK